MIQHAKVKSLNLRQELTAVWRAVCYVCADRYCLFTVRNSECAINYLFKVITVKEYLGKIYFAFFRLIVVLEYTGTTLFIFA